MIVTALCDSYKAEIMAGVHSLADDYRMALYTDEADLNRSAREYTPIGEVSGDGYEAGGISLGRASVRSIPGSAVLGFDSVAWERITVVAAGAMIYNASKENRAVAVFDFGNPVEARNGRFAVTIPTQLIAIK